MRTEKLTCTRCKCTYLQDKKWVNSCIKRNQKNNFCSVSCANKFRETAVIAECLICKINFKRTLAQYNKSINHFCSLSCAATYRNNNKTTGIRRSKLEAWMECSLVNLYPSLVFHFNKNDAIKSELDIYIPELNLAFELNGIFHYEPIFGLDKLSKIKNNDNRKFQACIENNISLCIIDTSQQKYFKKASSEKYLKIIVGIINDEIVGRAGGS